MQFLSTLRYAGISRTQVGLNLVSNAFSDLSLLDFLVSIICCFPFYCFVLFALYLTEVVKSRVRQLSSLGIVVDGTKAKPQQGNQTEGGEISPARYSITNQRDNH